MIYLTETYLDSSLLSHDPNLEVQVHDLTRADRRKMSREMESIPTKKHHPLKLKFPSRMSYC